MKTEHKRHFKLATETDFHVPFFYVLEILITSNKNSIIFRRELALKFKQVLNQHCKNTHALYILSTSHGREVNTVHCSYKSLAKITENIFAKCVYTVCSLKTVHASTLLQHPTVPFLFLVRQLQTSMLLVAHFPCCRAICFAWVHTDALATRASVLATWFQSWTARHSINLRPLHVVCELCLYMMWLGCILTWKLTKRVKSHCFFSFFHSSDSDQTLMQMFRSVALCA